MKRLSALRVGDVAIIESIDSNMSIGRLLEMGCIPGQSIEVVSIAPFNGPFCIRIQDGLLSLRQDEAQLISVSDQ